jgi:hypothetical protein
MSKTLDRIRALPYVGFVDDERGIGNSIIVTLADGYEFVAEKGCGVRGFDTVQEAKAGCTTSSVQRTVADASATEIPAILRPFQDLLDAGAPAQQIIDKAGKHIEDLRGLPPGTQGVAQAIKDATAFLASLHGSEAREKS